MAVDPAGHLLRTPMKTRQRAIGSCINACVPTSIVFRWVRTASPCSGHLVISNRVEVLSGSRTDDRLQGLRDQLPNDLLRRHMSMRMRWTRSPRPASRSPHPCSPHPCTPHPFFPHLACLIRDNADDTTPAARIATIRTHLPTCGRMQHGCCTAAARIRHGEPAHRVHYRRPRRLP